MKPSSSSPSLKEIQELFSRAIVARPDDKRAQEKLAPWIAVPGPGPTPAERLDVYGDAWYYRLDHGLRDDYPTVFARTAREDWHKLISGYLREHPSRTFLMSRIGDELPEYMKAQDMAPWRIALAEYERARYQIRIAADPVPWDLSALQNAADPASVRLTLQSDARLFACDWNVDELNADLDAVPAPKQLRLLLCRDGFGSNLEEIETEEFAFLSRIAEGATLGELADTFGDSPWLTWLQERAAESLSLRTFLAAKNQHL